MDLGLTGRVALVTAGARGSGIGMVRALASEGAAVAVHGFEPAAAAAVARGIVSDGGRAAPVDGDLLSDAGADRVVAQVEQALGPVEILVNNYGVTTGTSWDTPPTGWHDGWERNVLTGVRMAQRTVPGMRQRAWGRVIFVSTIGTARPGEGNPDYYGAKAALPVVARSLAKHLRGTGITVNVVSPGIIGNDEVKAHLIRRATEAGSGDGWEAAERWALEEVMPNLTERIPDPVDIGRLVAFLASEAAWHVNGTDVRIDGGTLDA